MPITERNHQLRRHGMSLVELIVAVGVFGFVVAGSVASIILFVKLATEHENRATAAADLRMGMEVMSFDVRNATRVTARTDSGFSLEFSMSPAVSYQYDQKIRCVTRTQGGQPRKIFHNVVEFDVLTSPADEPADRSLAYDKHQIAIETLRLSVAASASDASNFTVSNYTLSIRNQR